MKIPVLIAPAALLAISSLLTAQSNSSGPQRCEALAKLDLPNVTVTTAKAEAAGEFAGPRHPFTGADISAFYKQLPAFCRVVAKAHPSTLPPGLTPATPARRSTPPGLLAILKRSSTLDTEAFTR